MAVPGGLAVLTMALFGMLDTTRALPATWGLKHFFELAALEESGCLPRGFELQLPSRLWVNAMTCRRLHPIDSTGHHHPHAPGAHVHSLAERRAMYLQCLAQRLSIIGSAGVDEAELDAFIETLPADSGLTDRWKANADTCLAAMSSDLTSDQQAVYLLSCLKNQLTIDCAVGSQAMCLEANSLIGFRSSRNTAGLVSSVVLRRCERQAHAEESVFSDRYKTNTNFCPGLLDRALRIAVCALRGSGLADGDVLNLTAVKETIMRQGDGFSKSQLLTALERCQYDSVYGFVRCWSTAAPAMTATGEAHDLALALPLPLPHPRLAPPLQ